MNMGRRTAALLLLLALGVPSAADDLVVSGPAHFTDNRGWNEAGLGPTYQEVVMARVKPSGFPTLVFAERDGTREPMTHFPQPAAPDLYILWRRGEPDPRPWRIVAERAGRTSAPASTPPLARPRQVPLATKVRMTGKGTQPQVRWALPRLAGFDLARIRVSVRGEPKVHGRFLSELYVSPPLPATATAFTMPEGVLVPGRRYVFQVALEELEGGALRNRSLAFSKAYDIAP